MVDGVGSTIKEALRESGDGGDDEPSDGNGDDDLFDPSPLLDRFEATIAFLRDLNVTARASRDLPFARSRPLLVRFACCRLKLPTLPAAQLARLFPCADPCVGGHQQSLAVVAATTAYSFTCCLPFPPVVVVVLSR
jgi:hypothetical protein